MCFLKTYYYVEQRHGHVQRERKVNYSGCNITLNLDDRYKYTCGAALDRKVTAHRER
jgi:hypothetical protein